jgi:hypothetical protein
MTGNINSDQFRKHPTGGGGLVNILRVLFLIGSIIGLGLIITSIYAMFSNDVSLYVVSKRSSLPDVQGNAFVLTKVNQVGILNFKIRNAVEWLLMPRSNRLDLYTNIFSFLITFQLFKISSQINMEKPFYGEVIKRLKLLHQLIIIGWIVTGIRYTYVHLVIKELTGQAFTFSSLSNILSPGYLSLGTWLIVLLFSYVYKKGLILQRDQDLTI